VYVTGTTQPTAPSRPVLLTAAFNASTGATLWLDSTGLLGEGNAIAVSPSGSTVFVGGTAESGGPTTVAYNAATGATRWTTNAGTTGFDISIAVSADGSKVFATGDGPPPGGAVSAAYNAATGATLWTHPLPFEAVSLALSPDGSKVYLAGSTGSPGTSTARGITQALDASTGSMLWAQTVESAHGTDNQSLAVSPDGSTVFVGGYTSTAKIAFLYSTVAYNTATGAVRWAARGPKGIVQAVAVSPDGSKVFVTGNTSITPTSSGFGTVANNAGTGAHLWTATGMSGSSALALAVSPGGSEVFVTGEIPPTGPTVGGDMGTAAYSS
jgi:WD40 repeat protein